MTSSDRAQLVHDIALDDERRRRQQYKFRTYFPDCLAGCEPNSLRVDDHVTRNGLIRPTCRVLYQRSLLFFAAGVVHNADGTYRYRERLFLAANRSGKTVTA